MHPDLVFDIGLHQGEDAEFYLKKGFRVVGVEASPALCELASQRLRPWLDGGGLRIVNAAIAETSGPVTFYTNDGNSTWGTTSLDWVRRNERFGTSSTAITVDGIRFEDLVREHGVPYYLKIDIEGADMLCVEGLRASSERPKYVSVESSKTSWDELRREFRVLTSLGYTRFKVVDQRDVEHQVPPRPAREGRWVEHRFVEGATGLFGEETPGPWLTEAEALERYRRIFLKYRLFGDTAPKPICYIPSVIRLIPGLAPVARMLRPGWHDTHAALPD